ncbi:MSC_0882 family membrane protein [Mycoplasma bradburyae]|uniref:MSC_0882 family membrane protein n=1 Tax=Mycoplasma bradburyae TaxID=2963128 RepID=UPI0020CE8A71|nr:hypothetical protein [Mycoplasma bradburyae]UTS70675.1 hypothetical protein NMG77_02885 [Mycoplasma bradburyae]
MDNNETKTLDLGVPSNHNKYGDGLAVPQAIQLDRQANNFYNNHYNSASLELSNYQDQAQLSLERPQDRKIPKFYKKEIFFNSIELIFGILVLLFFGSGLTLLCLYIYFNSKSWHILWSLIPFAILAIFIGYRTISNYANIKSGLKHEHIFNKNQIAVNIKRAYKSLRILPINVNWLSAGIYITVIIAIVVTLVTAFAVNLITIANNTDSFTQEQIKEAKAFGYLYVLKPQANLDSWPLYSIIVNGSIGITTLVLQIYLIINSSVRARSIENYYGKMPIEEQDIQKAIESANKRNFKIFLVYLIVLGLIMLLAKKIISGSLGILNKKKVVSIG